MSAEWQHGLFGCFDNLGLCIISYFVPCYTFGKNAEAVGEGCFLCGLMYIIPIANIIAAIKIRGKIRESRGIAGSTFNDLLMICCCTLCALVQEAQEVQGSAPGGVSMLYQQIDETASGDMLLIFMFIYAMLFTILNGSGSSRYFNLRKDSEAGRRDFVL